MKSALAAWRRRLGDGPAAFMARGAAGSLLVRVAGSALLLAVQVTLARKLGVSSYGAFAFAWAWVNLLSLSGKLGLDTATLRFGSAYREQQRWGRLRGLLSSTNRLVLASSTAIALVAAVWVVQRGPKLDPELAATLLVAWLAIPFAALSGLRQSALRAFRAVIRSQVPENLLRPALLLALLLLLWPLPLDGPAAMGLNVVAVALSFAVGAWWLYRRIPDPVRRAAAERAHREWLGVSGFLFLISLLTQLTNRVDTLLIGSLLGTREVGLYTAAGRLVTLMLYGLLAMNTVAAPMIAEAHAAGDRAALQRVVRLAGLGIMAFTVPAGLVLLLGGRPLLGLFGPEFAAAYPFLAVLTVGHLCGVMVGPVGFMMSMTGHQRQLAAILAVFLGVNVVVAWLSLPRIGAMGAALATAIATVGWRVSAAVYVRRRTGIDCLAWMRPGPLAASGARR